MMGLEDLWTGNGDAAAGINGLEEEFHERLVAIFAAMPDDVRAGTGIRSGYRSYEEQAYLYDLYINGNGNLAAAPGKSNHNHGRAMDIEFKTDVARKWFHANGARFGLAFPIQSEDWHIEPAGLRDGTYKPNFETPAQTGDPDAYPDMPPELRGPDNGDMRTQLTRVADMLMSGGWASKNKMRLADPAALAEQNISSDGGRI